MSLLDKYTGLIKNKTLLIWTVVISAVLFYLLFSSHGIVQRISLEYKLTELKEQLSNERKIKDSLQNKIRKLRYDTLEIERAAREKFGMVKDGEKVYYIKKQKDDN